jgi:structural maintenance of chromosome 2
LLWFPLSVEKQEEKLRKQYKQILADRANIEKTVAQLDEYKKEALVSTWQKVNRCAGGSCLHRTSPR